MRGYVIEQDCLDYSVYPYKPNGQRRFYVSSSAKGVDHRDVHYAKVFPSIPSVKQALKHAHGVAKVFVVETSVKLIEEVEI